MRSTIYALIATVTVFVLLAACTPAAPTAAPAKPATGPTAVTGAAQPTSTVAAAKPAAGAPTPAAKIKRGGILTYASAMESDSWDPVLAMTHWTVEEIPVLETLLSYILADEATGKHELQPLLAEAWEIADPTTVVLKLRKGVKFHDGSEFNAEVAKWNLERARDHPKSSAKRLVSGVDAFEVVDPFALKLRLKQPSAIVLLNLTPATGGSGAAGSKMVSKTASEKLGEESIATKPVGTGPMMIVDWKKDDRLTTKRWGGYWGKGADGQSLPYLDGINARIITDPSVIFMDLRAGTVHASSHVSSSDYAAARANPDLGVQLLHWANDFHVVAFNPKASPWAENLKLRQAALYAIDQKSLADAVGFGLAKPNEYLFWGPGMPGYDASLPRYEFNLEKAKQLLREAGYPEGLDIAQMAYPQPVFSKPAEILQSMWSKVGIRAKLDLLEVTAARAKQALGEFEAESHRAVASVDPANLGRMFVCGGAGNQSNYCNPEADKCMLEGERTYDFAERDKIYKRCEKILYEDAFFGGLHRMFTSITYRKELKGLSVQFGRMDLREAWLDK